MRGIVHRPKANPSSSNVSVWTSPHEALLNAEMCDGLSSAGFAWSGRKRNGETSAMMSFHSESGRGPGLSDKSHVFPPAFDTGHMLRLSTGRPWQSLLNAVSAARTRSPAVAEAIGDHGKLPKGVARQLGIKIMFLLVKPDGMSAREFHQYWLETHSPLVVRRSDDMAMRRYVQSHLVPSPMAVGAAEARGWPANPFQGAAEVWWDSEEAMAAAFSTPNGADAGEALAEDEKKFLDDRSIIVMTREYLIFDKT